MWGGGGGEAYARDKNTSARLCAKNAGGAYARGGAYLRDMLMTSSCAFRAKIKSLASFAGRPLHIKY